MADNHSVEEVKRVLRREYSARRNAISAADKAVFDAKICDNIRSLEIFRETEFLAAFIRLGAEPDLSPLFSGKRLFLPRFNAAEGVYEMVAVEDIKRDLLPGKYGIPEPLPTLPAAEPEFLASRVLFLVPAVACDRSGNRMGRGGGYYDRLLSGIKIPAIATIYSCQLTTDTLPGTAHDVPMGTIVTEREVVEL